MRSFADELKLNFDVEIGELARHVRAQGEHGVLDGREFDEQRDLRVLALQATQEFAMPLSCTSCCARNISSGKEAAPTACPGSGADQYDSR